MESSDRFFKTLIDNVHEGIYFVDPTRTIQYWNAGAQAITGYDSEEVIGKCCAEDILVHVDEKGVSLCKEKCPLAETIQDGQTRETNIYLHHKAGHRLPVHVSVAAVRDNEGQVVGALEAFYDNSSMMAALQEIEQLRALSLICPLTGVGNRRYAESTLAQRLAELERNASPFAVAFMDIDRFKVVNDTYGHVVGDSVLRMVSRTLANTMRSYDFLGRWGGEEFVAILPYVKPDGLEGVADRFRALVETSSENTNEHRICVTISIGACVARSGDTAQSLVERADRLMYQSKERGRNCVTVEREAGASAAP
ncbi:MAG TPA: sensor domain-containing diguanylate cyclase [Candidatus Hydrogenedentes bacterium]|nr:sensor domain-containing diguanylate cyclase [Candidatus Hydrogenedentota bacterium]HIJ74510.1 sensor domain-containing diguanylate cyclase [Candidatus Hydrogenedentota bacterium]